MMILAQVTLIPLYILMIDVFDLGNTYTAILLPGIVAWHLLDEAVHVITAYLSDSCGAYRRLRRIRHLLEGYSSDGETGSRRAGNFTFVASWNDFFWPFLVTNSTEMRTIQVGLASFVYADTTDFGALWLEQPSRHCR